MLYIPAIVIGYPPNRTRAHNLPAMLRYVVGIRVLSTITISDEEARQGRIMATENAGRKVKVNCRSQFQACTAR